MPADLVECQHPWQDGGAVSKRAEEAFGVVKEQEWREGKRVEEMSRGQKSRGQCGSEEEGCGFCDCNELFDPGENCIKVCGTYGA